MGVERSVVRRVLIRLKRLFRRRLPLLLVVVLLGTLGAGLLVGFFNRQIRPTFEAIAVYSVAAEEDSGNSERIGSADLESAQDAAIEANADFVDATHGVRANISDQTIEFIVSSEEPEEAARDASEMRSRYLVAIAPPPIEERMRDVLGQAHFVRETLDALDPPEVNTSDPAVVSEREALDEQIRSLNGESARLAVDLVLADTDSERTAIQEDLDAILSQIVELRRRLEALPEDQGASTTREPGAATEESRSETPSLAESNSALDDQFQIESLESLYSSLLAEFQDLYIESINAEPEILPKVEATDETSSPIAIPLGLGAGFAVSLLLGLGAIVVGDRLRPRWWAVRDVARGIAEIPDRRKPALEPWYWTTGPSKRKQAIQKVAVSLLPDLESGVAAIGVVGATVSPASLRAFAVDLAGTMVTSGRSSLVIDATGLGRDAKAKADPEDNAWDGPTVGDLLNPWNNGSTAARVDHTIADALKLWPGLSVIPSGSPSLYSVEGAMTPVVDELISSSRKSHVLTFVPIADRGSALTDALVLGLDAVLIVGRGGSTRLREANELSGRLSAVGGRVLGSALILKPPRRRLRDLIRRDRTTTRAEPQRSGAVVLPPVDLATKPLATIDEELDRPTIVADSNGSSSRVLADGRIGGSQSATEGPRSPRKRGSAVKPDVDSGVAEESSASAS